MHWAKNASWILSRSIARNLKSAALTHSTLLTELEISKLLCPNVALMLDLSIFKGILRDILHIKQRDRYGKVYFCDELSWYWFGWGFYIFKSRMWLPLVKLSKEKYSRQIFVACILDLLIGWNATLYFLLYREFM